MLAVAAAGLTKEDQTRKMQMNALEIAFLPQQEKKLLLERAKGLLNQG